MIEGKKYIGMDLDKNFLIQDIETKEITTLYKNDLNPYTVEEQFICLIDSIVENHPFNYFVNMETFEIYNTYDSDSVSNMRAPSYYLDKEIWATEEWYQGEHESEYTKYKPFTHLKLAEDCRDEYLTNRLRELTRRDGIKVQKDILFKKAIKLLTTNCI